MLFEWDEGKRETNLRKHRIDFQDAKAIFDGPVLEGVVSRDGENRIVAVGLMRDIEIVVVYVVRGERRRIISARRASRDERKVYKDHLSSAGEGQD